MYLQPQFAETEIAQHHRIIQENSLGMLVRNVGTGFEADHLPFLLDPDAGERGTLIAHVARANSIWQEVRSGDAVMVVFRGSAGLHLPKLVSGQA